MFAAAAASAQTSGGGDGELRTHVWAARDRGREARDWLLSEPRQHVKRKKAFLLSQLISHLEVSGWQNE